MTPTALPHRRALLAGASVLLATRAAAHRDDPALRALVDGGTVALIRHARAPGTGDPPGFRLGDCSTQRNLSDEGRRQAAALGDRMRAAGVMVTDVRSSRWCRALHTAELAFPTVPTIPDAALNSFFDAPSARAEHTDSTRALVTGWQRRQGVLALVTHQVNVTALTGIVPAEGEVVVLRPGVAGFQVMGRTTLGA